MTPLEYLEKNAPSMYLPFADTIVEIVPKDYNPPFRLPNGRIYCTGSICEKDKHYVFIKNYKVDGCIYHGLKDSIFYKTYNPRINDIGKWITNSLFNPMLETAEMPEIKTELVKLRIAVNMILQLHYLSAKDKIAWTEWIKELYWNRKAVLHKWYIEEVLPF